jgi:hypothetical protein
MSSSTAKELDELYPKTPWWTNLVAVILTMFVTAILSRMNVQGSGATTASKIVTDTALFLPHALILFGIFADMFSYQGAYSLASLFGFSALLLNKTIDYAWSGIWSMIDLGKKVAGVGKQNVQVAPAPTQRGGAVENYTGCYVQGFEGEYFQSKYSSQTLVVTSTVLLYYIVDLWMNKGASSAIGPLLAGAVLLILQISSMSAGGCFPNESIATKVGTSLLNGLSFAFIFYFLMESYAPNLLPSKVIPSFKAPNPNSLKMDEATGKMVDADGNPWTFDANGNLIPDTCGSNGKGGPATEGSCPESVSVN